MTRRFTLVLTTILEPNGHRFCLPARTSYQPTIHAQKRNTKRVGRRHSESETEVFAPMPMTRPNKKKMQRSEEDSHSKVVRECLAFLPRRM